MRAHPNADQLATVARLLTSGLAVAEYEGRTMTDGVHVLAITRVGSDVRQLYRIAVDGQVQDR